MALLGSLLMEARYLAVLGLVSLVVCGASATAHAYHAEDSLSGGTTLGNAVGGEFTADGWRVTDRSDRMWFEVPRLVSGSIEVTVTGILFTGVGNPTNIPESDYEILSMYEAGYGIGDGEPIRYAPFIINHYKTLVRIYGAEEPGRPGEQKLLARICPGGAPGYLEDAAESCPCPEFHQEPFGGDGTWDGSPERIRLEWGDGTMRLLRNGALVLSVDWSASGVTFAPDTLHFALGSPRPTAYLPVGAVFSDLVVDGVEGARATCSDPAADAGPAPVDAGSMMSDAGGPTEDAGAASSDGGAVPADGGVLPADGGPRAGDSLDSGCGCRAIDGRDDAPTALLISLAAFAFASRRRR